METTLTTVMIRRMQRALRTCWSTCSTLAADVARMADPAWTVDRTAVQTATHQVRLATVDTVVAEHQDLPLTEVNHAVLHTQNLLAGYIAAVDATPHERLQTMPTLLATAAEALARCHTAMAAITRQTGIGAWER